MEVLLAAANSHLDSTRVCDNACWALSNIVDENKENTRLLISLGGAAAVSKVREEWPDDDAVQTKVQRLIKIIATEMNSWRVRDYSCNSSYGEPSRERES
jgi:hypothetical protein